MKPFDIELAKQNYPVQTLDGRPARIICYDRKESHPLVVLVENEDTGLEDLTCYTEDGVCHDIFHDNLVMAPVKVERWINVYRAFNRVYDEETDIFLYTTEEEAISHIKDKTRYITTIKIEFEDGQDISDKPRTP